MNEKRDPDIFRTRYDRFIKANPGYLESLHGIMTYLDVDYPDRPLSFRAGLELVKMATGVRHDNNIHQYIKEAFLEKWPYFKGRVK